jgi:hypothetical protein
VVEVPSKNLNASKAMNGVPLSRLAGMMKAGPWSVLIAVAWTLRESISHGAIDAGTEDKPAKW